MSPLGEGRCGYYVRELTGKKKFPKWKVQFISHKKADAENPYVPKPKKEWDVPRDRWRALGFLTRMTVTEARTRAKQLNSLYKDGRGVKFSIPA